jgi:GAF domain-containing protein
LSDILHQVDEDVLSDQIVSAIVYIYEEGEGFYSGVAHGPLQEYMIRYPPRIGGTGEYTIKTKQPLFVSDVTNRPPEIPPLSRQAIKQGVKAFANLPLLIGEEGRETLVGVLLINLQQPYDFDEDRQAVLRLFANQAAIALQNARVQRRRLREQDTLHRISESAVGGKPEQVGDVIARQVVELTRSAYATVCSADLSRAQLELKGAFSVNPVWQEHDLLLPIDEHSINGHVARTKQPYYTADLNTDHYYTGLYKNLKAAFCVPLLVREELIGTLYVVSEKESGISAVDQEFIKRLAPHAALAIRNAELYSLEQRRNRDLDVLNQVALRLAKVLDIQQAYQVILEAVIETLDCDYCTIFLAEINNRLIARAAGGRLYTGLPELEFAAGEGLAGWVYQQDQSLIVNNTAEDPRYKPGLAEAKINPRSIILAPMKRGKQLIGVISATFARINAFNEKDLRLLETLTLHVGTVLQNIEFFNDFEVLHRVANDLAQQPVLEQIYHMAVQSAHETLHCRHSTIFMLDKKTGELVPMARLNADEDVSKVRHFKTGEGVAGLVLQTGQSAMVNDAARDEYFIEGRLEPRSSSRSIMVAPIKIENDVIGVLSADKDEIDGFTEHNLAVLELLALDVGIAINARRQQDVRQAIADFQSAISDILPVQQQLDQIHDKMSGLMDTRNMYIALYDEQTDIVEFPLAYEGGQRVPDETKQIEGSPYPRRLRRDKGLTEWVLQQKQPLLIDKNYDAWIEARPEIEYYTIGAKCWLGAPMLLRNQAIGIIALRNYEQEGVFDETHRDLLLTIAGQAAVALDNARQYDVINNQLQRRIKELEAVSRFQQQISDLGPVEEELQAIYDIAAEAMSGLMDTREMLIALYDEATGVIEFPLVYRSGEPVPDEEKVNDSPYARRKLGERGGLGLTEWVIQHKQPLLIEKDFKREAKAKKIGGFPPDTQCWLGVPMLFREKVIGVISLRSFEREAVFDAGHRDLLMTIAGQAAIALDNARQYDVIKSINSELQRRIKELEAVRLFQQQISRVSTVEQELQEIYDKAAEAMSGLMDTRNMYIALYNEETEVIEFPLAYEKGRRVPEEEKVKFGPFQSRHFGDRKGLTEWVIRHKQPFLIEKAFDAWVEQQEDIEAFPIGTKCWLGAPMLFRDKVIGVIGLQNFEQEGVFDQHHRDLLMTLAGQAAIAIENARQYDLINNQLQRRIKELEAVNKFQQDISSFDFM